MGADKFVQVGFIDKTFNSLYQITQYPTWAAITFKQAVYTSPAKM